MRIFLLFLGMLAIGGSAPGCASGVPGTIGAALGQQTDHRVFVRAAPPGEGASMSGILVDDEVVALDGKPVQGMSPDDIRRAVRGDVGSVLTVTIVRGGERRDVRVTRTPLARPK